MEDGTQIKHDALINFYIEDFKNISEKLESTDKKCQFVIQLYGSLTTILFTIISIFWNDNNDTQQQRIELILVILLLTVVGEFIYRYVVLGGRIHLIYLNQMNKIRDIILNECGLGTAARNKYGFTGSVKPGKGMGYTMQEMLKWLLFILDFIGMILVFEYFRQYFIIYSKNEYYYEILALFAIFVIAIPIWTLYMNTKYYNEKFGIANMREEKSNIDIKTK